MADSQETAARSLASISTSIPTDPLLTALSPPSPKKRFRSPEPTSLDKSVALPGGFSPTGLSEMAEAKRRRIVKDVSSSQTSKNPAAEALSALAASQPVSKISDAPANSTSTTPAIAPSLSAPETATSSAQTSPTTVASTDGIPPSLAQPQVASPGAMDQDESEVDAGGNKAFSYPGPLLNAQIDAKRGMSLPGSASRENNKSSAAKKHKCPFCSTEFTRHHNLKSHLLTHSHEKPYLCQTCDSRFRRLHDLKRHTKLHTGERPHICPKCNRRFARGDALARHAKGQGGCAGRRSSVGEYAEEDSMEGMVYTDGQSHEPENMEDEDTGSSVPAIRHHAPTHSPYRTETSPIFSKGGSTYPPIAARANMGGGLQPPINSHPPDTAHASSAPSAGHYSASYPPPVGPGGVFPTSQMTESPKPLSPGILHPGDTRNRAAPSMNQSYSRRGTRNTPPLSLPPPVTTGHQLPSLSGLAPPDSRYVLHSTPGAPSGPSPTLPHPSSGTFPPHSASNSLSSHGTGHHGSGERANIGYAAEDRLWAVIKSMELKMERMEAEIRELKAQQQVSPTQTMSSSSSAKLPPPPNR